MNQTSEQAVTTFFKQYCSEEWIPLIQHHMVISDVKKNHAFIHEGEPVAGMYLLISGKAKVVSHFYGKNEHIFRLASEMSIVGHRSLFLENYSISAIALIPCTVAFIPLSLFVRLYKANTAFSLFLLEFLTQELNESEEQQYMLTIDSVRRRVAYCLLKLVRTFGYDQERNTKLAFTLSRKDIATLCNTTYESVIRTLSALEKEKITASEGKTILILQEEKLRTIAVQA